MALNPEKKYFKIGEVARLTKVKPHVLRYWESEFKIVSPGKSNGSHRQYTKKDVDSILLIKKLLYKEGFTLEGAKKRAKELQKEADNQLAFPFTDRQFRTTLKGLRKELTSIKKLLVK
jgi:DNA-binding transcriptional MerR regulator